MLFFREAMKKWKEIGAVTPCSNSSVEMCIKQLDLKNSKVIVELGCGNGVFTKEIQRQIKADQVFFGLELNEEFVKLAKEKSPSAKIYQDSAEKINDYLKENNATKADCVISTLPWTLFSKPYQKRLIGSIRNSLSEKGEFITIAYTIGTNTKTGKNLKRLLDENFQVVRRTPVIWNNIPPAIFYHCKGPRSN